MLSDVRAFIHTHGLGKGLGPIDEHGDPDRAAYERLLSIVDPGGFTAFGKELKRAPVRARRAVVRPVARS